MENSSSSRPFVPSLNISQPRASQPPHEDPRTQRAPSNAVDGYGSVQQSPRYSARDQANSMSYGSGMNTSRGRYGDESQGSMGVGRRRGGGAQSPPTTLTRAARVLYSLRFPIMFVAAAYGGAPLHKVCLKYAHYYTYREHDEMGNATESTATTRARHAVTMATMTASPAADEGEEATAGDAWASEARDGILTPVASTVGAVMRAMGIPTFGDLKRRQFEKNTEGGQAARGESGDNGDSDGGDGGGGDEPSIVAIPIAVIVPLLALTALAAARYVLVKPPPRSPRGPFIGPADGSQIDGGAPSYFPPSPRSHHHDDHRGNSYGNNDATFDSYAEKQRLGDALNRMGGGGGSGFAARGGGEGEGYHCDSIHPSAAEVDAGKSIAHDVSAFANVSACSVGVEVAGDHGDATGECDVSPKKIRDETRQPLSVPPTAPAPVVAQILSTERRIDWDDNTKEASAPEDDLVVPVPEPAAARSSPSPPTPMVDSSSRLGSTSALLDSLKRNASLNRNGVSDTASSVGPLTTNTVATSASEPGVIVKAGLGGSTLSTSLVEEPVVMLALAVPSSVADVLGLFREAVKHKVRRVVMPSTHAHFRLVKGAQTTNTAVFPAVIRIPDGVEVEEVVNVRQYCIATREIISSIAVHRDVAGPVLASPNISVGGSPSSSSASRTASFFRGTTRYTGLQWFNHPFNGIYVFETLRAEEAGPYDDGEVMSPFGSSLGDGPLPWCDFHIFLDMEGTSSPSSPATSPRSRGVGSRSMQPLNFLINLVLYHRSVKPPRRASPAGEVYAPSRHSPLKRVQSAASRASLLRGV